VCSFVVWRFESVINAIITSPFGRAGVSFSYHMTIQRLLNVFSHADFDSRCSPPPICVIEVEAVSRLRLRAERGQHGLKFLVRIVFFLQNGS
jgi:hypothetical protein